MAMREKKQLEPGGPVRTQNMAQLEGGTNLQPGETKIRRRSMDLTVKTPSDIKWGVEIQKKEVGMR